MTPFDSYITEYIQRVSRQESLDTLYDFGGNITVDLEVLHNNIDTINYYTKSKLSLEILNAIKDNNLEKLSEAKQNVLISARLNRVSTEVIKLAYLTFENDSKYISNTDINESIKYYSKNNITRLQSYKTLNLNTICHINSYNLDNNIVFNDNSIILIDMNNDISSEQLLSIYSQSLKNKNIVLLVVIGQKELSDKMFREIQSCDIDIGSKRKRKYITQRLYISKKHLLPEDIQTDDDLDF